jgi:hypothetical protein
MMQIQIRTGTAASADDNEEHRNGQQSLLHGYLLSAAARNNCLTHRFRSSLIGGLRRDPSAATVQSPDFAAEMNFGHAPGRSERLIPTLRTTPTLLAWESRRSRRRIPGASRRPSAAPHRKYRDDARVGERSQYLASSESYRERSYRQLCFSRSGRRGVTASRRGQGRGTEPEVDDGVRGRVVCLRLRAPAGIDLDAGRICEAGDSDRCATRPSSFVIRIVQSAFPASRNRKRRR